MNQNKQLVIFGEVLFDCFSDGRRILGGAPFNVAWNLKALGAHPLLISSVGNDEMGTQILEAMNHWGLSTDGIQVNDSFSTGMVDVRIENNEPYYDIVDSVAYDYIEYQYLPYLPSNGIIYHGSLALRHKSSRRSLDHLIAQMDAQVFIDVNLRPPWWENSLIEQISRSASWLKLNQYELAMLTNSENEQQGITQLFALGDNIKELILTQGETGALAITSEGELNRVEPNLNDEMQPELNTKFVDTVGAGDAFSSVLLLGKYFSWPTDLTMHRAQQFASAVIGLRGATTTDKLFYQNFMAQWENKIINEVLAKL